MAVKTVSFLKNSNRDFDNILDSITPRQGSATKGTATVSLTKAQSGQTIIVGPLAAGLAKNLGKKMGKATLQASEISGKLVTLLSDIFKASKMIRVYQKEDDEKKKF